MITFCIFFPMFAIHMCEKMFVFSWHICQALCFVCFCVCTCTNQLVLSTEVTRLNFLNSIVMGQINQCGFQSHVAIDRYCIFLEINTFELSWVEFKHFFVPPFVENSMMLMLRCANPIHTIIANRPCELFIYDNHMDERHYASQSWIVIIVFLRIAA